MRHGSAVLAYEQSSALSGDSKDLHIIEARQPCVHCGADINLRRSALEAPHHPCIQVGISLESDFDAGLAAVSRLAPR